MITTATNRRPTSASFPSPGSLPSLKSPHPHFLPYQSAWIRDPARLKICVKSRQVGLSYTDAYDSVLKAARVGGRDVWVMSRDEIQARQYIRACAKWVRVLDLAARDLGEQLLTTEDGKGARAQMIQFASGACIFGLSSNPDAIVGKSGHVKLDEFALHKDQRLLYALAKPVTQWGGTLSIISTHRGRDTTFNEILTEIRTGGNAMGWSLHEVPITRAVQEGLVKKINARSGETLTAEAWMARQRAECIDEEQWLQEYCCVPADERSAFLSFELICACEEEGCVRDYDYLAECHNPLFLGVDVARKHDLCVFDVGEQIGDVVWDRMRIEFRDQPFARIEAELFALLRLPAMRRACIDSTGMGMQIAERATREFGGLAEGVHFTAQLKEQLAYGLRHDLQDRRVRLERDDKLRADLRGLRKEVTSAGNIRFAGESPDSHCDRTWALALRQYACHATTGPGAAVG